MFQNVPAYRAELAEGRIWGEERRLQGRRWTSGPQRLHAALQEAGSPMASHEALARDTSRKTQGIFQDDDESKHFRWLTLHWESFSELHAPPSFLPQSWNLTSQRRKLRLTGIRA